MKNFKLLTLVLVHFLAILQGVHSQVVVTSANPGTWSLANVAGYNAQAPTAAFLDNLNYNLTPVAYPGNCSNINNTPAPQMTVPTPVVCGAQNQTRYYRTTFNLDNNPECYTISARIRADDAFRVFINGTQVGPGTLTLINCNGNNLSQLNGNNWNTVYTLPSFLSLLTTGQNTLIIEVPNCQTISYLSALFTFNPLPALPTGNQIHFSTVQGSGGYQANLWGVSPKSMKTLGYPSNFWTGNWTIESSNSPSGPWTPFTTNAENTSSQISPWQPALFLYGKYYRVTYQITTICGYSSANSVYTFFVNCQGCLTNGGIIEEFIPNPSSELQEDIEFEHGEIMDRDGNETQTPISEFINYNTLDSVSQNVMGGAIEVFQKVYVDQSSNLLNLILNEGNSNGTYVEIYSTLGKMIWAGEIQQQVSLDISDWVNGIYIIHAKDRGFQTTKPKKVLICRTE